MKYLAQNPFGTVGPPEGTENFAPGGGPEGLPVLLSIVLRTLIVLASVFAVINFVLAGWGFMSAGGDPKKISDAWAKIWQTMIGLLVTGGAFIIAALVGKLIFGRYDALLQIQIFTPN